MCGRFTLKSGAEDLLEAFPFLELPDDFPARFNIAPTQLVAAVLNDGNRAPVPLRWGLVPFFASDLAIGSRMINARSETAAVKPAFREPLRRRRCLVLADGFYEWRKEADGKTKTPMHIRRRDGKPFAFAGLWDRWRPRDTEEPDPERIRSCTILTTEPNDLVRPIHDRMPVILDPDHVLPWIEEGNREPDDLLPMLGPCPSELLETQAVSTLVNSPKNDLPECLLPAPVQGNMFD